MGMEVVGRKGGEVREGVREEGESDWREKGRGREDGRS